MVTQARSPLGCSSPGSLPLMDFGVCAWAAPRPNGRRVTSFTCAEAAEPLLDFPTHGPGNVDLWGLIHHLMASQHKTGLEHNCRIWENAQGSQVQFYSINI